VSNVLLAGLDDVASVGGVFRRFLSMWEGYSSVSGENKYPNYG
jgi:hypothetical protein